MWSIDPLFSFFMRFQDIPSIARDLAVADDANGKEQCLSAMYVTDQVPSCDVNIEYEYSITSLHHRHVNVACHN